MIFVLANSVYNYFRDYDPSIGRYIESDPIGLAGGVNTYSYVLNNPLYWTDSEGLRPIRINNGGRGTSGNPRPIGRNLQGREGSWYRGQFYPRIGDPLPNSPIRPRKGQDANQFWNYWNNLPGNNPNEDKTGPNDWLDIWKDNNDDWKYPNPNPKPGMCS